MAKTSHPHLVDGCKKPKIVLVIQIAKFFLAEIKADL